MTTPAGRRPPMLFLDVDGVINATPGRDGLPRRLAANYLHTVVDAGGRWPIWYDPQVVAGVNELSRHGTFEIVWLTTWEDNARTRLAPALGLDDWPAITIPAGTGKPGQPTLFPTTGRMWWKTAAVADAVSDGRAYAWVDDDLHRATKDELRRLRPAPSKLLTPFPAIGMTTEHLAVLQQFTDAVNQPG